jgi:cellulose biosynthesis protein BcsQ
MATYAIWNNKGGVGKSYLTFQIASHYASQNPNKKVVVIDLCPQSNSSAMILGGMFAGESNLNAIHASQPRKTISGYIDERITSPYVSPKAGAKYLTKVDSLNTSMPNNLHIVVGDEYLEIQSSRVYGASQQGPTDGWRIVHLWVSDLIEDIKQHFPSDDCTFFIDCNPSFSIYTELALTASDRLLIPFSADGSSKRAVKAVLSLIYGITRNPGEQQSEFFLKSSSYRMSLPQIYMYIGNRLTQMNNSAASAFKTVVEEIGDEIWGVWQSTPQRFCIHPTASPTPMNRKAFKQMFQFEVNDANTASVVSSSLGIPISKLSSGQKIVGSKSITVNQSQLDKQVPNIRLLVQAID